MTAPTCFSTLKYALSKQESCLFLSFPGMDSTATVLLEYLRESHFTVIEDRYVAPKPKDIVVFEFDGESYLDWIESYRRAKERGAICLGLGGWSLLEELSQPDVVGKSREVFDRVVCQKPGESDLEYDHLVHELSVETREKILELSGGHPRLASRIKELNKKYPWCELETIALRDDYPVREALEGILRFLSKDERDLLGKITRGQRLHSQPERDIALWLCKLGVLTEDKADYRVFARLLHRYVADLIVDTSVAGRVRVVIGNQLRQCNIYFGILVFGVLNGVFLNLFGILNFVWLAAGGWVAVLSFSGDLAVIVLVALAILWPSKLTEPPDVGLLVRLWHEIVRLSKTVGELPAMVRVFALIVSIFLMLYAYMLIQSYFAPWDRLVKSKPAGTGDQLTVEFPEAIVAGDEGTIEIYPASAAISYTISHDPRFVRLEDGVVGDVVVCDPRADNRCAVTFFAKKTHSDQYPVHLPITITAWGQSKPAPYAAPIEAKIHDKLPDTLFPISIRSREELEDWHHQPRLYVFVMLFELVLVFMYTRLLYGSEMFRNLPSRVRISRPRHINGVATGVGRGEWRSVWNDKIVGCVGSDHTR